MKNKLMFVMLAAVCFFGFTGVCHALEMLNTEQALKEMFPDAEKIENVKKTLVQKDIDNIKSKLGGTLVYLGSGKASTWKAETEYTLYYGIKGGQKTGVALIEEQPGKWGPVKYIVLLDIKTAKVKNMAVMALSEKRGRPIASKNFLGQFTGKGSEVVIGKGVTAVSGATISSEATCFTVKKVIAVYNELAVK
ncbi:MAG: FMN-binding protein [Candidatus Firestonebacteria bacterium]